MRLTAFTDYTIRTLIYLALRPDRLVTINDISEAYGISNNHLMKVVHQLAVSGDVATLRGQRGGLRLGRPAAEINLGTVVRRVEPDMRIAPCFSDAESCAIRPECVLREALQEALASFLSVLDRYTLADLLARPAALAQLLGIQPTELVPTQPVQVAVSP